MKITYNVINATCFGCYSCKISFLFLYIYLKKFGNSLNNNKIKLLSYFECMDNSFFGLIY